MKSHKQPFSCIVIDDEEPHQQVFKMLIAMDDRLKLVGWYFNAYDGIAMIAKKKRDLVFLDVNMLGMTGPKTLLQIREAMLIVIIATANPEDQVTL